MIPYFLAGLGIGSAALTNSDLFIFSAMYIILIVIFCAVMYARTHIEEYVTVILPVRCTCGLLAILSARAVDSFLVSSRRDKVKYQVEVVIHKADIIETKRRASLVIMASHTFEPIYSVSGAGSASGSSMSSAWPRTPLVAQQRKESVEDGFSEAVCLRSSRKDSAFGAASDSSGSPALWPCGAAVERDPRSRPACCPGFDMSVVRAVRPAACCPTRAPLNPDAVR